MELKVYRMNDCDWWADYSEVEADLNYMRYLIEECGVPEYDVESEPEELSEEEMCTLEYITGDGERMSFQEYLPIFGEPGFFASTEW